MFLNPTLTGGKTVGRREKTKETMIIFGGFTFAKHKEIVKPTQAYSLARRDTHSARLLDEDFQV